jgi:hypothetical protein
MDVHRSMAAIRRFVTVACLMPVASALRPRPLDAQTADYFQAFVVPPRSAGTCMPANDSRAGKSSPLTDISLVMVSLPPGSRREMIVWVDSAGSAVGYTDLIDVSTSPRSGKGDDIVARIDRRGRVVGWRMRTITRLPDSVSLGSSPAALRSLKDHMITTSSRDTLSTDAQRHVRELAKWLRDRCPA